MAEMLLDRTLFDDLRSGDAAARATVESILDGDIQAAISPLTVFELWQSGDIDRRTEIGFLSVLRFVEEAPPNIETARTAGLLAADYQKGDESHSLERDVSYIALVAATAIQLDIPICTRAADAFAQFGVEIIAY
ncbi:MAG: type II toxin-antitoxin system VapC family toxin [Chloroflexi bacterium]|nr:type II toxin-antitoxin system VapC family toxin [Chloroflexota bacterium]